MAENNVFVSIDFGQVNASVDKMLESDDIGSAKEETQKSLGAREEIKRNTKAVGGKLIFDSGINLTVYVPYDEELIESFANAYEQYVGGPANIGIGRTPVEAHNTLDSVQDKSVDNIVLPTNKIIENMAANREYYKKAEKTKFDLKIASVIKSALLELNVITTEDKVYDIFLTLVKKNSLDTVEALMSFFNRPLEELKSEIREIYQSQKTAGLKYAIQTQTFPGQTNVAPNKHQKSPHRRHNWWSIEDYNQDAVDYRKTDMQFVDGNVTTESQNMSMGGEPGNAISTT